jgi:hydroxyacyl-ACP dehydratase HTD2-like protein with hotdog domain
LYDALAHHLSLAPREAVIEPGFQQVSFNELIDEDLLCEDGADRRHAPGEEWKFRVWAGGHMKFSRPYVPSKRSLVVAREEVKDVRVASRGDAAKVFVTLLKRYHELPPPEVIQQDSSSAAAVSSSSSSSLSQRPLAKLPVLVTEEKRLCFMRNVPVGLQSTDNTRVVMKPPSVPFHAQSMTSSPALLFRFSALTRNDHAIHLDADFTRRVYGIHKLLVHGPLTAVLMLEVLRKGFDLQHAGQNSPDAGLFRRVREFEYKNLLPLFVDEEMTIACKRIDENFRPADGGSSSPFRRDDTSSVSLREAAAALGLWERWDVWIQKGQGENATVAVRGKALVSARSRRHPRYLFPAPSPASGPTGR